VQSTCDQLLASAGFAVDQNRHIGLGCQLQQGEDPAHGDALGDQIAEAPRLTGFEVELLRDRANLQTGVADR
jgi:hypothetical protein